MSMNTKKSIGFTILLMLFGVTALYTGVKSLMLLVPAALLVWYEARSVAQGGRN